MRKYSSSIKISMGYSDSVIDPVFNKNFFSSLINQDMVKVWLDGKLETVGWIFPLQRQYLDAFDSD